MKLCNELSNSSIRESKKRRSSPRYLNWYADLKELNAAIDHSAQEHLMFPASISFQSPMTSWVQQSSAPADSLMVSAKI